MDGFLTFRSCNRKAIQFLRGCHTNLESMWSNVVPLAYFMTDLMRMMSQENMKRAWSIQQGNAVAHALLVAPRIINYFSGARMWSFAHERMPLRPLAAANLRKIIRKLSLLARDPRRRDTSPSESRATAPSVRVKCSCPCAPASRENSPFQRRIVLLN